MELSVVTRSHPSSLNLHRFSSSTGLARSQIRHESVAVSSPRVRVAASSSFYCPIRFQLKWSRNVQKRRRRSGYDVFRANAADDDPFDDWAIDDTMAGYMLSSDGEYSDGDLALNSLSDEDLPLEEALAKASHRLASRGKGIKRHRIYPGLILNLTLIVFVTVVLLVVDWCGWKIVRLPLAPFYLTSPFFISLILASCASYVGVPLLRIFKFHEVVRKIGPPKYMRKKRTPTMGGLFFVPVGIAVARFATGVYSVEVAATAAATFAFAAIGLLDDALSFNKRKCGMDPWLRLLLEAAVGVWFSYWLDTTNLSTPYGMKMLVPLPLGLQYLGKLYLLLTPLCFVSMGKGANLADGLDGLVAGTAASAFIGMAIAVLPICPELSIFGATMAGACIGFLLHNQYKAAVIMGDTGSSALGGALAAMAACTGMFFPLFIASGFFVLEVSSVIMQVLYFKYTKHNEGSGRRLFKMVPLHLHLELCGHKETTIVAGAYAVSCVLALFAAYIGLKSA
ncbi:phospho-N-acetylmuramoyl-pentapeptide-transferase homolog isoform X1 [Hibiscus syriacus]|uniref:phospho-N-acetylmuramoyl-pentapeptide- transferase homolog isoform X1 n=2 Tax=Hibiscus syriacus TaxID=106335 RepID=UPI001924868E|nr:phospho-N-acetylmuramoyl-pentapeptide-transferase homolog isoform X1 [Hibiscus syriacus]XP_039034596.1 phospho-N-acetylmuramoyl-pentapeptide-transferase homolog isoform X1 [Hibiscus syriacus]